MKLPIRKIVTTASPGVVGAEVSIVDANGTLYFSGVGEGDEGSAASLICLFTNKYAVTSVALERLCETIDAHDLVCRKLAAYAPDKAPTDLIVRASETDHAFREALAGAKALIS